MKHTKKSKASKGRESYDNLQGAPQNPMDHPATSLPDPFLTYGGEQMPLPPGTPPGMDQSNPGM